MKEKIEETYEYKGIKHLYRRYFDDSYTTEDILKVFESHFPHEFKTWAREIIGGNRAAHGLTDNND